jgi:hypothetical protein
LTSPSNASSRAFQHRSGADLFERGGEQVEEILADRLHDVIGGTGLQRGDRDAAFLGTGDVHDRRMIGQAAERFERLQAVHAGHVVIDRDQVEALGGGLDHTLRTGLGDGHAVAAAFERTRRQPPDTGVVVDVEDAWPAHSASGTWITDRNSPSWRIACAKLS